MKRNILLGIVLVCVTLIFIVLRSDGEKGADNPVDTVIVEDNYRTSGVLLGEKVFVLDIADTSSKRTQGLSGRVGLNEQTGMLFIFDKLGPAGIWMKDMNFAIDILWLDSGKKIIHTVENATPESFPKAFTPPSYALYVIELPVDTISKNNVKVGDFLEFNI